MSKPVAIERDPLCSVSSEPSEEIPPPPDVLDIDMRCKHREVGAIPAGNYVYNESDKHDVYMQTRGEVATNTDRPLIDMEDDSVKPMGVIGQNYAEPSYVPCIKIDQKSDDLYSRNPITGFGLNGDGVGGLKPKKLKHREGNPVTGEGYKPGATDYIQPSSASALNGSNQVINKNRVPPGGYSSGLW
ncbi:microtubule-associated protein Jupiter isoform X4 [Drosophila nasuta]|uniref:Microtubule-associated protein Jupiter isoform X5 n=1 Tax=Drosophila albomicans TaxID=7291 RepID=A0A6P8XID1_DROAB|nr:microtubule-associated protein Jupiter isoform X5 [Drosophila albomicans]XP_060646069.1 microtubule-associated protein Jupiter isoform X4 [Drosophila nasuta]